MPILHLPATPNTPEVYLNAEAEEFFIRGISTSLRSIDFFESIIQWIDQNESSFPESCSMQFQLPHFNSSSVKALIRFIIFLKQSTRVVWSIRWVIEADDEFMLESAENLQDATGIHFEFVHL
jgi:hypothetical protein